jgi:hypothetical protein
MQRYFFDFVSKNETLHDYQGRTFAFESTAKEHAELLTIHLQHDPSGAYAEWTIVARNERGTDLFSMSVPVPAGNEHVVFKPLADAIVRELPFS